MMQMFLSAVLCGLMATMPNTSSTVLHPHLPLIIWSQRSILAGSNAYINLEADEATVTSILNLVLTRDMSADNVGVLSTKKTPFHQAELLCLFLLPSMALEDMTQFSKVAGSFMQNSVHNSVSSIVFPHTTRTKPLLSETPSLQPHIINIDELNVFITSAKIQVLLSNGKTDLLVVQLPETMLLSNVDAAIDIASSSLIAASGDKVDFAVTGNVAMPVKVQGLVARRLTVSTKVKVNATQASTICEAEYLVGYNAAGKAFCFSHYVAITPDILAGLLFGLLFIFLAYVGLSVLHQIQTPQRYPSQGPPRGKEF